MRWLQKNHEWSKFIKPDELYQLISESGLTPVDKKGFVFNPLKWSWSLSDRDLSVNYVTAVLIAAKTNWFSLNQKEAYNRRLLRFVGIWLAGLLLFFSVILLFEHQLLDLVLS